MVTPIATRRLHNLDPDWRDIIAGVARAERNLLECQPGFPASTPGNGSPGGGSSGHGDPTARLVEHHALTDKAADHLAVLRAFTEAMKADTFRGVAAIVRQWDYPTAGETTIGTTPRSGAPKDLNRHAPAGCTSCFRIHHWAPAHRGDLCKWCGDFQAAEGFPPPLDLLVLHCDPNVKRIPAAVAAKSTTTERARLEQQKATKKAETKANKKQRRAAQRTADSAA